MGGLSRFFFFFQAEDGIRDSSVTGVQTCALPILSVPPSALRGHRAPRYRQHSDPFARIDAHVHVDIWQQLQLVVVDCAEQFTDASRERDRKSTRLNSSHT